MRARVGVSKRGRNMSEIIAGSFVAALLGAFLVYTLLHPKKF